MVDASDRIRKLYASAFAQQYRAQTSNISTGAVVLQKEIYSEIDSAKQLNYLCTDPCANSTYNPYANQFSGANVQDRCTPKFSWQTSTFTTYYG